MPTRTVVSVTVLSLGRWSLVAGRWLLVHAQDPYLSSHTRCGRPDSSDHDQTSDQSSEPATNSATNDFFTLVARSAPRRTTPAPTGAPRETLRPRAASRSGRVGRSSESSGRPPDTRPTAPGC